MNIIRQIQPLGHLARYSPLGRSFTTTLSVSATKSTEPSASTRQTRNSSSTTTTPTTSSDAETNQPLAFFGSNAAAWTARQSQSGGGAERMWYQPLVISGSLAVFLMYFCILREESDIDGKLDGNLFDHVAGLEETQLRLAYNYNREHGISTEALERRLDELEAQKALAEGA